MTIIFIIISLQAVAIGLLYAGIRTNERSRGRYIYQTPGGRTILVAYGVFIVVFGIMVLKLLSVLL